MAAAACLHAYARANCFSNSGYFLSHSRSFVPNFGYFLLNFDRFLKQLIRKFVKILIKVFYKSESFYAINTCDPQIDSSFIPIYMLIGLLVIRLLPIVLGVLLAVKKTPLSEGVAQLVEKLRKGEKRRLYVKKQQRTTTTFDGEHVSKSTTFGVDGTPPRITSTPLPPVPSPAQIDHSISYNNAAYFATSGAFSSRSSDISRIDASELFKNPINRAPSGSLQSEV
nr:hypothetical protein R03H10.2 - Caenorhabditis elegans [Caenorhabditis elegans]